MEIVHNHDNDHLDWLFRQNIFPLKESTCLAMAKGSHLRNYLEVHSSNSLVDYCLVREKDGCIIKSFRTGDISIHSDHAFLPVSLDKKSHSTLSKPNLVSKANCILEKGTPGNKVTEELRENYNCRFV